MNAAQSDGAAFGGTDRRWSSAEACHPLLAIARAKHANPVVLLDELDKSATRTDYGRLWDCVLGFLEIETARAYPDPALYASLDLSHISYIATANTLDGLPAHLLDRFRIAEFPKPSARDLERILPGVVADLARERNLDVRWITPLSGSEQRIVAASWQGGSVRLLRRLVEALLRHREAKAPRN
jgi:ATP-dependent Lon protease